MDVALLLSVQHLIENRDLIRGVRGVPDCKTESAQVARDTGPVTGLRRRNMCRVEGHRPLLPHPVSYPCL